jgi:hypothetical protein
LAGSVSGVGIYLVNISAPDWAQDERAPLLNEALAARGLPPYSGPPATAKGFEEKLTPDMDAFYEMCARYDATDAFGGLLIVPVDFTGLITIPAKSNIDDVTTVSSAWRVREAIAPMAADIDLPTHLPSGPMALSVAIKDPLVFYIALFQQAAEHSLRYGCPLDYV